jgi:hypothetical protein
MSEIAKSIEELKEKQNLSQDDLIALGLGVVPAQNDYTAFEYNKTREVQLKDGSLMDYRYDHILEWFNNEVYDRTINLSPEDKDRYFQMITDYHDILQKLANDHNNIIWEFAAGNPNPWANLEKHAEKANVVVDYDKPKQLIKEYEEWKARKAGTI